MVFRRRTKTAARRLGILPGTFNPVTTAHLALAHAALSQVDEVVFVLPRILPHKAYSGASFDERLEMLEAATAGEERWSVAVAEGGLFAEIAAESREAYGAATRLSFICGRDAAERIAGWDYDRPEAFPEMLREFDLLVAPRGGCYRAPDELASAIRELAVGGSYEAISATEVRNRIVRGEPWEHLVPRPIHDRVRQIYRPWS